MIKNCLYLIKQMKNKSKKQISGKIFFAAIALFGLSAGASMNAQSSSTNTSVLQSMGLNTSQPALMSNPANPYGNGTVTLNPFNELAVRYVNNNYNGTQHTQQLDIYDSKKSANALKTTPLVNTAFLYQPEKVVTNAQKVFSRLFAADLYGQGKKNFLVEVYFSTVRGGIYLDITDTFGNLYVSGYSISNTQFSADLNIRDIGGFLSAASGDFNGDGKDELAVYCPPNASDSHSYIKIFTLQTTSLSLYQTITLPVGITSGSSWNRKDIMSVQMTAGNLLNNGYADLVVMANYSKNSGLAGSAYNSATMMFIYRFVNATTKMGLAKTNTIKFEMSTNTSQKYNLRGASAAIGDINGDGTNEIVVGGYYSNNENDWDLSAVNLNKGDSRGNPRTALGFFNADGTPGKGSMDGIYYKDVFDIDNETNSLVIIDNTVDPPAGLATFKANGNGTAAYIFLDGRIYTYGGNFQKNQNATSAINSNVNGQFWGTDNHWFPSVAAANFTHDPTGQESVIYVHSYYNGGSTAGGDIGSIIKNDITANDAWTAKNVTGLPSYGNTGGNTTLVATDVDNDAVIVKLSGQPKDYYFTDPKILTVLQAAPHFAELENVEGGSGYSTNGATLFGTMSSSGVSNTESASISAGVIVGFKDDVTFMGITEGAGIDIEATVTANLGYQFEWSDERTVETTVSSPSDVDRVLVTAVPYTRYYYQMWVPTFTMMTAGVYNTKRNQLTALQNQINSLPNGTSNDQYPALQIQYYQLNRELAKVDSIINNHISTYGATVPGAWKDYVISVPNKPRTILITVDKYDQVAQSAAGIAAGMHTIRGSLLLSGTQPGYPESYRNAPVAGSDVLPGMGSSPNNVNNNGQSVQTEAISHSTSTSNGVTWGVAAEVRTVINVLGVKAGISQGLEYQGGYMWSNTSGNTFSGAVSCVPIAATGYGFDWRFTARDATLNGDNCKVLEYVVTGVTRGSGVPKTDVGTHIAFSASNAVYSGSEITREGATISGITASGTPTWTYTYATGDNPTGNESFGANGKPVNAGNYTVFVKYEDVSNIGTKSVSFTVTKIAGSFGSPAAVSATYTYGMTLADFQLPNGYVWTDGTIALNAGDNQTFAAVYTNPNGNYTSANGNITVNVEKAAGDFGNLSTLSAIYTPTLTLADLNSQLPENYVWVDATTSLNAGDNQPFAAVYTNPTGNYYPANGTVLVNVAKALGTFGAPDTVNTIYTPTLTLADLKPQLATGYAWTDPTIQLNAGANQSFVAVYDDPTGNYEAPGIITVNVQKATGIFGAPPAISTTYTLGMTLQNLNAQLSAGYVWANAALPVNAGDNQSIAAVYTNPNGNYTAANGNITVSVAKALMLFPAHSPINATYSATLTLANLNYQLADGYAWANGTMPLSVGDNQSFAAVYTDPSGNFNSVNGTIKVNIAKAAQTITFDLPASKLVGDVPFNINADVNSGLPLTYLSYNTAVATIDNEGLITIVAPGMVAFTISQAGDANYLPASEIGLMVVNVPNGIETILSDNSIIIYPNPVRDELHIARATAGAKDFVPLQKVEIVDLSGKTLLSQMSNLSHINVANLPSGIYFLKIQTDKGVVTKKFIKE